jgi:hypothetical protein
MNLLYHNAGYLGGLVGAIAAIVYVRRIKKTSSEAVR